MSQTEIAVTQGLPAQQFQVLDHQGLGANSYNVSTTLASRGDLMMYSATAGQVFAATSGYGAGVRYAGFIDNNVIAYNAHLRVDYHGENAIINKDFTSIWNQGRFRITNVEGVVGDNVPIYPSGAKVGGVVAAQVGSDRQIGICRKGNAGVSGGAIEVEIDLLGN